MRRLAAVLFLLAASGCVDAELRKVARVSSSEAQAFKRDFARFDEANRRLLERRHAQLSFDELGTIDAQSKIDFSERMLRTGDTGDLALYGAATPPWLTYTEPQPVVLPARWDPALQNALIESLQKASRHRGSAEQAELLLNFLGTVAGKMKKEVSEQAASTEQEASQVGK
jgi:hypothetical protein